MLSIEENSYANMASGESDHELRKVVREAILTKPSGSVSSQEQDEKSKKVMEELLHNNTGATGSGASAASASGATGAATDSTAAKVIEGEDNAASVIMQQLREEVEKQRNDDIPESASGASGPTGGSAGGASGPSSV